MTVKESLQKSSCSIPDKEVALFLSAGIDSASILFSLQEAGKDVTCYTFMLDHKMSTDFKLARRNAEKFGAKFVSIILPSDVATLKNNLRELSNLGARSKTDFECFWPMLHAYKAVKERVVFSGMGADGHFCISKKGMIHYRDRIDEFRKKTFSKKGYSQQGLHKKLATQLGKVAVLPYLEKNMQDAIS